MRGRLRQQGTVFPSSRGARTTPPRRGGFNGDRRAGRVRADVVDAVPGRNPKGPERRRSTGNRWRQAGTDGARIVRGARGPHATGGTGAGPRRSAVGRPLHAGCDLDGRTAARTGEALRVGNVSSRRRDPDRESLARTEAGSPVAPLVS